MCPTDVCVSDCSANPFDLAMKWKEQKIAAESAAATLEVFGATGFIRGNAHKKGRLLGRPLGR